MIVAVTSGRPDNERTWCSGYWLTKIRLRLVRVRPEAPQ